ncbi:MAG TPA: DUF5658 family protein [Steroidobacteraceae bacterium]|nr:DUF5658 family protein [Steroidobacteraceae bacterium]
MATTQVERRKNDRRRSVLRALWHGNFARRRHAPRRSAERHTAVTDWFHPQWLAVGITVLLLSLADALLTLTLISHGAIEVNPLMDPLVRGSGRGFAFWKIGLTAVGVVTLILLARLRVWGRTVGNVLYLALAVYIALVVYELFLLRNIPLD